MGFQEDVRWPVDGHAERFGGLNQLREGLIPDACGLDPPVHNLDEDAPENCAVEHLAKTRIGLFVGLTWLAEKQQRVVEGLHDVVDLGDGLVLPAFDLGLLVRNALLFSLEDFDGDGVAVVELNELLLLGSQLAESPAVAFGFGLRRGGLGANELPDGFPKCCLLLLIQPRLSGMQLGHDVLDPFNRGIWIAAGPTGSHPAQTRVVLVVAAELAAVTAVTEPGTADAAVE